MLPSSVSEFETDRSIYGIYGLAGNVQDFCLSHDFDELFITMGGAWSYHPESLSMSHQRVSTKEVNTEVVGFRLVSNLDER